MGTDIHVYLAKKALTYSPAETIAIYNKQYNIISPYSKRDYNLFHLLTLEVPRIPIEESGSDLPIEIQKIYKEYKEGRGGFKFYKTTLADIKNFLYQKKRDAASALTPFVNSIENYLNFAEPSWAHYLMSDICIYYWFDN